MKGNVFNFQFTRVNDHGHVNTGNKPVIHHREETSLSLYSVYTLTFVYLFMYNKLDFFRQFQVDGSLSTRSMKGFRAEIDIDG